MTHDHAPAEPFSSGILALIHEETLVEDLFVSIDIEPGVIHRWNPRVDVIQVGCVGQIEISNDCVEDYWIEEDHDGEAYYLGGDLELGPLTPDDLNLPDARDLFAVIRRLLEAGVVEGGVRLGVPPVEHPDYEWLALLVSKGYSTATSVPD